MKTLKEVYSIISGIEATDKTEEINLQDALGRILAEQVFSDIDMPPFNKSAMDGYACRKSDLKDILEVNEYIPAGFTPHIKIEPGTCAKIMTGAVVPEGADCVIMVEHTETVGPNKIRFIKDSTKENICYLGEDVKKGDCVLNTGVLIKPAHMAIMASVGKTRLKVYTRPEVSVITTGDEIVEPGVKPGASQIRNSNAYNIMAQIRQCGISGNYLGIVKDNSDDIESAITKALNNSDILILTGGVSMGDKDYVPDVLQRSGLELKFDRVAVQPGKPVAFATGKGKYCFGLSGNPVSSLLQFELFIRPLIYKFMGHNYKFPFVTSKLMSGKERKKNDRMQFFPVKLVDGGALPIEFHGSAHIAGLTTADGFAYFKIDQKIIKEGDEVHVLLI